MGELKLRNSFDDDFLAFRAFDGDTPIFFLHAENQFFISPQKELIISPSNRICRISFPTDQQVTFYYEIGRALGTNSSLTVDLRFDEDNFFSIFAKRIVDSFKESKSNFPFKLFPTFENPSPKIAVFKFDKYFKEMKIGNSNIPEYLLSKNISSNQYTSIQGNALFASHFPVHYFDVVEKKGKEQNPRDFRSIAEQYAKSLSDFHFK